MSQAAMLDSPPAALAPAVDPPILVTDGAVAKVKQLLDEQGTPQLKLRIYVSGGGCSGFEYGFALAESANEDDMKIEKGGLTLLVDAVSFQYLIGAQIDYEDGLEGSRFRIRNPNATGTCGCGESFQV